MKRFLSRLHGIAVDAVLFPIRLYRKYLSPLKPPCCRFTPTCSAYAVDAVRWAIGTGILKGDGAQQLELLSPLTRAQAAAVVRRYLQQQESLLAA